MAYTICRGFVNDNTLLSFGDVIKIGLCFKITKQTRYFYIYIYSTCILFYYLLLCLMNNITNMHKKTHNHFEKFYV